MQRIVLVYGLIAGAILSKQGVNLAALDNQVDAVVRDNAGEPLDDSPHLDCWRRWRAVLGRHGRVPGEGSRPHPAYHTRRPA